MEVTLKDISENYEKLHRLKMINTLLRTISDYVTDIVTRVEDDFDDCEDFKDGVTKAVVEKVNQDIEILKNYL